MESKPPRAKRRISSRPSQGLKERFKRSTFCALVSLIASAIFALQNCRKKEKPTARCSLAVGITAVFMKFLSQQFTCTRAHACTTTTRAHADLARVAETCHTHWMLTRLEGSVNLHFFLIASIISIAFIEIYNGAWKR